LIPYAIDGTPVSADEKIKVKVGVELLPVRVVMTA
jgi:hypothetical protein